MRKPNKKIMKRWIKALRSGKYKQTSGKLQDTDGFCCLGVACELFNKSNTIDECGHIEGYMPDQQNNSPKWLCNINEDLNKRTKYPTDSSFFGYDLPEMNDKKKSSFDEIADLLQAVYIEDAI